MVRKIRLTAQQFGETRVCIGGERKDDAIQLRSPAIIRRVSQQLQSHARVPRDEPESAATNWMPNYIGRGEFVARYVLEYVFRQYMNLKHEIVELLRSATMEPDNGRQ